MWAGAPGSGPWPQQPPPQWPMQQAMYQNIPHEQVDWAALAQQWIQMREIVPGDQQPPPSSEVRPPIPNLQQRPMAPHYNTSGNGVMPAAPLHNRENASSGSRSIMESRETVNHSDNSNSQDGSTYSHSGDWGYWQSNNWNASSNWAPPHPPESKDSVQTFEYGHMHGNQGYSAQTYDYNHGSDQCNFAQNTMQAPVEQPGYNQQYWIGQGGPPPPPFLRRDRKDDRFDRESSPVAEDGEPSAIDAAKRKNLPAWIREGLEKMERDKQKKIEYECMLKEREERLKLQREEEERVLKEMQEMAGRPSMPRKSKFESDSDNENSSSPLSGRRSPQFLKGNRLSPIHQRTPSPIEAPKTEQERLEQLMQRVRKMLTEILLEVTSEEIAIIAKETIMQAQAKAPAQQLAKSSALASISGSLGGLGGYGSDSEETGSEIENDSSHIQRKPARDREIVDYVPSDLSEEENDKSDSKNANDVKAVAFTDDYGSREIPSLSPSNKEMYHFEKKYEEIPGLDVPVGIDESETNTADSENKGTSSDRTEESAESERSSSSSSTRHSSSSSSSSKRSASDASIKRRESVKGKEAYSDKDEGRVGRSPNKSRNSNLKGKRESRSRSYDRARSSRNRSRDRSERVSRNRVRSRSRNRGKSRSRSRNRGRSRSRSRNLVRSRSRSRNRGRSRSRNKDRRESRRSRSHNSSSRSRSAERSRESGRRSSYRGNYLGRRKRSLSRSRSRRSPVGRRRRTVSKSRSRSRSPKSRSVRRPLAHYSRSSSQDSSDHKMGKKSSRKPRV